LNDDRNEQNGASDWTSLIVGFGSQVIFISITGSDLEMSRRFKTLFLRHLAVIDPFRSFRSGSCFQTI